MADHPSTPARLFTSVGIGPHRLRNRVVMAPMTRSRAGEGNAPTELTAEYYAQRASAGLIVTEASQVSPEGVGYPFTPGIHTDAQVRGWRRVTDAVHGRGGLIFLQLWHVGRISHPDFQPGGALPVAPSAVAARGEAFTTEGPKPFPVPRALDAAEIPGVVAQFAEGARRALDAGFDGVEIHGANGYLIDQFLRDGSNRRTDAYGGPVANRVRFLLEVTDAVAGVWGAGRVGVRVSPWSGFNDMSDADPAALFVHAAERLSPYGLGYLHLVEPVGTADPLAPALKAAFKGPLMVNGGHGGESAEAALASGSADLVSFGAPFVSNPDLPERLVRGAPLAPADSSKFYGGGAEGYTDYPALRPEAA
jgi:N-ethylmaleimide reductase